MEYADERKISIARAVRRRSSAEERVSLMRIHELSTFRDAIKRSETETETDPRRLLHTQTQRALDIARMAQETLVQEETLAEAQIAEAELRLQGMRDEAETITRKRRLAEKQVDLLLKEMAYHGLPIAETKSIRPPRSPRYPEHVPEPPQVNPLIQPPPSPDDSESGSEFESYYDASICPSDID